MNPKNYLANIRQLIADNKLDDAIRLLQELLTNSPNLNEVLLQSSRYRDILQQIRLGVVDFEQANITKNQIRLSLLELVSEIDDQKENPVIREEIKKSIAITNSKNVVMGNLSAGGNIQIGDQTIHSESNTSKRLRLFLFFLVPILAIGGTYLWYQNQVMQQPLQLKVLLDNRTPNAQLPEPSGTLTLTYGGEPVSAQAVTEKHLFENIPANFKEESFRLQYQAAGYVNIDTTIPYAKAITLPVYRNDDLAQLNGYVYEENTEPLEGIAGVKVSIACCSTFTDAAGKFNLHIPFAHQREKQRLEFFKEDFHQKSTTEPVIKGVNIQTYLIRK